MLSRLNFCVNSLTPHSSKNKRHKPYFLPHVVTVALCSSKILTVRKLHGQQDDNKNTYEANILCSLTFKVFQKHTSFSHDTFATAIAETSRRQNGSSPKRQRRTVLDRTLHVLCFTPVDFFLRDLSLCDTNLFVR